MKKHVLYVSIILSAAFSFIFLFNNMTPRKTKLSVEEIVAHSKRMSLDLKSSQFSDKLKEHTRKRKIITVNYLSAKVLATSCKHLLSYDKTVETGVYNLFPSGKLTEPQGALCEIKNSKVVSEHLFGDLNIVDICNGPNGCKKSKNFFRNIACVADSSNKTSCTVKGVHGFPNIKKITHGECKPGDYGFEEDTGIWVKNGCGAIFTMNRIPKVDIDQSALQPSEADARGKNKRQ